MNHDEIVLWAYEQAEQIATSLGEMPGKQEGEKEQQRSLADYAKRYHTLKGHMASGECPVRSDGYIYPPEGGRHPVAEIKQMPTPEQVATSVAEEGALRIVIERVIEQPILSDGRRYIDLALTVKATRNMPDLNGYGAIVEKFVFLSTIFCEIKPKIPSLGELMRQLRIYSGVRVGDSDYDYALDRMHPRYARVCVISPDTRFRSVIEEQGFPFIVPAIGQQSLF